MTRAVAVAALLLSGCTDEHRERMLAADAKTVAAGEAEARAALERLVAAGRPAIPAIETALYGAKIEGRLDLMVALRRIGDSAAIPLILHRARWDKDERVRNEAEWTLRKWAEGSDDRSAKSRRAVRELEESRADEKSS